MVVGTLSLVQKCQTSGCSHTVDTVDAVDAVCSECSTQWNSGIWWWGHCSLVQKGQTSGFSGCSHTVDTVHSGHSGCSHTVDTVCSGIVVYGGGDIVFDTKKVKPVDAVCSTQWM